MCVRGFSIVFPPFGHRSRPIRDHCTGPTTPSHQLAQVFFQTIASITCQYEMRRSCDQQRCRSLPGAQTLENVRNLHDCQGESTHKPRNTLENFGVCRGGRRLHGVGDHQRHLAGQNQAKIWSGGLTRLQGLRGRDAFWLRGSGGGQGVQCRIQDFDQGRL